MLFFDVFNKKNDKKKNCNRGLFLKGLGGKAYIKMTGGVRRLRKGMKVGTKEICIILKRVFYKKMQSILNNKVKMFEFKKNMKNKNDFLIITNVIKRVLI